MKRFMFDPYAALKRAREAATPPTLPTLTGEKEQKVGRVGRVGILCTEEEKVFDALDHFEERAAIREYGSGQTRTKAELAAMIEAARATGLDVVDLSAAIASRRKKNRNRKGSPY